MFDRKKASKWLDDKCGFSDRACELCNSKEWSLSEDIITPIIFSGKNTVIGGNSYPQLMVICSVCGNTKYINTVIMGITKENGKENV